MKTILVPKFLPLLFISWSGALSADAPATQSPASTGARVFMTPAATTAQTAYIATVAAAGQKFSVELETAGKAALAAGNLDEANAINAVRQDLAITRQALSGLMFKTAQANQARIRYETAVAAAQKQYVAGLQSALKSAMTAGNLTESNTIDAELKALAASAAIPAAVPPVPFGQSLRVSRGLQIVRYKMHSTQTPGQNYEGYVPYTDLGKPLGAPKTQRSISSWTKEIDENAVVSGLIKIDKPGLYEFRTDSDFDRNELLVNGEIVCKFRDGSNKTGTVELPAGMIPIISVGYAVRTKEVRVHWRPPGQAEWSAIPNDLLYRQ